MRRPESDERHVTVTDSPPSTFSLSPQSGRSYRTPSPAGDFESYSDYSWADPEPRPISTAQPNRSFPAEPLVVLTNSDSHQNEHLSVESNDDDENDNEEEKEEGGNDNERAAEEEEVDERGKAGPGSVNRRKLKPDLTRKAAMRKSTYYVAKRALLGLRACGFALCLISLAVMASNRDQGWALDSFYRYKEFKYCFGVNLLGFVYSGFQVLDLIHFATTRKHLVQHRFRYYSDFFIDQAIAYLLMSASSSASTRVYDWQSNWGKDKFPDTAHVSVGFSFAAFASLALTSLISGYMLCTAKSL